MEYIYHFRLFTRLAAARPSGPMIHIDRYGTAANVSLEIPELRRSQACLVARDETSHLVETLREQLAQAYADVEREQRERRKEVYSMREMFMHAERQRVRHQQSICCQMVQTRLREHFISLRAYIQSWALAAMSHCKSVLATRLDNFELQLAADRASQGCWSAPSTPISTPIRHAAIGSPSMRSITKCPCSPTLTATNIVLEEEGAAHR